MHTTASKIIPSALKTLSAAVACAILATGAHAASLGKLTVLSALGQPLRAEIEVVAAPEEMSSLAARLAPAEAYRQANVELNAALASLRFTIEQRAGRPVVVVTSSQPVNEPFVDMLLEISSNTGRLVREYTFLLDPAELRAAQPAQVVAAADSPAANAVVQRTAPAPAAAPAAQKAAPAPAQAPAERAAPAPRRGKAARPAGPMAGSNEYKVKSGDSLGFIANQVRPNEVSLDQMLVALYRANPDAFIGNNMNRMKSGQILKVPDEATVRSVSEGDARGVVIAQASDFNNYRNKLAGAVQQTAPEQAPEARQAGSGRITAKVEEKPTAANTAEDKLKLSRTMGGAAADGGKAAPAPAAVPEDKVAQAGAASEASERVKELERNVNELERLMALKSRAMANAGQGSTTTTTGTAATSTTTTAAVAAAGAAKPKRSTVGPAPAAGPGMVDSLLADPRLPLVGGGLLAALLALLGLSAMRKRRASAAIDEPVLAEPVAADNNSLFAATGGASVDTNNSVFNSNFAPSASQLDTNEVDPVAEADVYIAYGRDVQAEEILKEALRTQPDRAAVRLKLLEIYANRKDTRQFEQQARELFGLTNGEGPEWTQAAALGQTIDPSNPLYAKAGADERAPQQGDAMPAVAAGAAVAASDELQDLDLDLTQAEPKGEAEADTSMDFSLDEEPAKPAEDAKPAAQPEDDNVLDFDLGGLSFDTPPAKAETPAEPQPGADAAAAPSLDDFDIAPVAAASAPEAAEAPVAAEPAAAPLMPDLSFDLDLPGTPPAEPAASAPEAPAAEAEAPAPAVPDFDMDIPALPEAAPAEAAPAAKADDSFDIGNVDFDLPPVPAAPAEASAPAPAELPDLDLGGFDAPPAAPAAPAPKDFDLSDIDLDLPAGAPAADVATAPLTAQQMEMDTKLDLALAYQEIGDKEGARELIDEVLAGGSPAQIEKANSMLAKLA